MGILLSSSWFLLDICPSSSPWISALLRFCFHLIPQVWSLFTKESSSGWSCAVLHGLSLRWKPVRWSNWSPRLWERWNNNCMTVLVTGSTFPVAPQCWQSWCHKNHCHQFMIHDWISFLQRHEFVVLSDVLEVCSEDLKMSALPADHRKYFGEMMEEVQSKQSYSSCQLWVVWPNSPKSSLLWLAPLAPRRSVRSPGRTEIFTAWKKICGKHPMTSMGWGWLRWHDATHPRWRSTLLGVSPAKECSVTFLPTCDVLKTWDPPSLGSLVFGIDVVILCDTSPYADLFSIMGGGSQAPPDCRDSKTPVIILCGSLVTRTFCVSKTDSFLLSMSRKVQKGQHEQFLCEMWAILQRKLRLRSC